MVDGAVFIPLGAALVVAVLVALITYRGRPQTPAVETHARVEDAVVETPVEAGEVDFPPSPSPASGAQSFDQHVDAALAIANGAGRRRLLHGWCETCQRVLGFCCAFHAVEHIQSHAVDFASWETELTDRSTP